MNRMFLLLPLVALLVAAEPAKDDAVAQDLAKLKGEWVMESLQMDGQKASDEVLKAYRRTIDGKDYTVTITRGDDVQKVKGTMTLDPTKKPKTIDVVTKDQQGNEITIHGIYELNDDMQKLCLAP